MIRRRAILVLPLLMAASPALAQTSGARLASAARRQIGVTRRYDAAYVSLPYPGGDPPRAGGACTDVVIRAARDAFSLDLQQLVHEDMQRAFRAYPQTFGLERPDANIDHRRVPNLETYWRRQGCELWRTDHPSLGGEFPRALMTGDILTWRDLKNAPHVGIVADAASKRIVHNIGGGVELDGLWRLGVLWAERPAGHYRWPSNR